MITGLATDGDPLARRALAELGGWLGTRPAQVATVLDPSVVIIGGGLRSAAGDVLLDPLRRAFAAASSLPRVRRAPPIRAAALGNMAGLAGAAALPARPLPMSAKSHHPRMNETSRGSSGDRW
jgi:glucokinase